MTTPPESPRNAQPGDAGLPAAAQAALRAGNKIEAIKIVRKERGLGLKESKDAVESWLAGRPDIQAQLDAVQAESRRGCAGWVAGLLLAAALAWYFIAR